MKTRCQSSFDREGRQGLALIVVLIAIFVLSMLVGQFAFTMKTESRLAQHSNNDTDLVWLGRSGVERARWILVQTLLLRCEPYDSLNEKWAGGPGTECESNSPLAAVSLDNYQVGGGTISLKIKDLERKFNINVATPPILREALTLMGVDASEIDPVTDAILDWVDTDNDPHLNGAESDYYQTLSPPYAAKNGPIDDMSELLFIKGIRDHRELYWGSSGSNQAGAGAFNATDEFAPPQAPMPGLTNYFTALSIGKVNINTAPKEVLQMLLNGDEKMAGDVINLRAGPDGQDGTEDDVPLRNVGELINAGLSRQLVQQLAQFCDVHSRTFEVQVDAEIGGSKRTFYAILGRNNQRDVQVLSFYW